jgi:two-component system phosphate regulon sensor histidine kinase PhoR
MHRSDSASQAELRAETLPTRREDMAHRLRRIDIFGFGIPRRAAAVVIVGVVLGALAFWSDGGPLAFVAAFFGLGLAIRWLFRDDALGGDAPVRRAFVDDAVTPGEIAQSVMLRFPDPVVVVDDDGRVVLSNRAIHPLIRSAEEGRHLSSVVRSPAVLQALNRILGGGGDEVVEFVTPVPVERHLVAYCVPMRVPAGVATAGPGAGSGGLYVLVVLHDLTAAKRAEQMRVDFIANASHELKTPLASLSGFIETLRGPAKDDAAARENFLIIMEEQAGRMKRLINDLLSLSRIELNEHLAPDDRVDLGGVVRDVVDGLSLIAQQNGVAIEVDAPADLPFARGARHELFQVFQNLIDNAVKYGRAGGRVQVTLRQEDEMQEDGRVVSYLCGAVRDFGAGIEREHVPRLTERFYRVDPDKSRREGGTGLGLAIVKHIINRHQGELEIESEVGEGTTVTVRIPVAGAD